MVRSFAIKASFLAGMLLPASALAQSLPAVTAGGDRVQGAFEQGDPVLEDRTAYRCHRLDARPGQVLRVTMISQEVDSFLMVGRGASCRDMTKFNTDDDGAGDLDAQVSVIIDQGDWWIRASSYVPEEFGTYVLEAEILPAITGDAARQAEGGRNVIRMGQMIADSLTAESPETEYGAHYRCYDFVASGAMVTEILLRSHDVDPYLTLKSGRCPGGPVVAENDDFDETYDSRVRRRLAPGPYAILARTVEGGETGDYLLSVSIAGMEDLD